MHEPEWNVNAVVTCLSKEVYADAILDYLDSRFCTSVPGSATVSVVRDLILLTFCLFIVFAAVLNVRRFA